MTPCFATPPIGILVQKIWAADNGAGPCGSELVLPTGDIHLVIRLSNAPLRIFDGPGDRTGRTVGTAVVGGARSAAYRRVTEPACPAVGVLLAPGACRTLLGIPASHFADCHVALEDIWPASQVSELRERLAAVDVSRRPGLMASYLRSMVGDRDARDARLALGVDALRKGLSASGAAAAAGLSRRQFGRMFLDEIGLSPRDWVRTRRFTRLVDGLHGTELSLAALAAECGFSDQPHMSREFATMAGITPAAYRRAMPPKAHHVPLEPAMSQSFKTVAALAR